MDTKREKSTRKHCCWR